MNWNGESFGDWKDRVSKRHKWFAWYPVWCYQDRKTVWLESVERILDNYSAYTETCDWSYRRIK